MISIIIPTRNEEKNIGECIRSINENKGVKYEIVVVDGKSKDRTREIAKKLGAKVIEQKKLKGTGDARNIGWKAAKYGIVYFLDADWRVPKSTLKEITDFFKKHNPDYIELKNKHINRNWVQKTISEEGIAGKKHYRYPGASVIKKSVLKIIGGYDDSLAFGEDKDLEIRLYESGFKGMRTNIIRNDQLPPRIKDVFKQGKWYGKSYLAFLRKRRDFFSLLSIIFFFIFPLMVMLSLFSTLVLILGLLQTALIIFYVVKSYFVSKSLYTLLIPLVKIVRSWGIITGIIVGLWNKNKGKD